MLKQYKKDKLTVAIYDDRQQMGAAAAQDVVTKLHELLATQSVVNMIFAAAPSQNEFLQALAKSQVDWTRVLAFHMDEYTGLPDTAHQRFGNFLKERLFDKLTFNEVHYLDGNAPDLEQECARYAKLLRNHPADIVCMGIGENGHLAFNDPPVADFNDGQLVKLVELDAACRQQQVNDKCFDMLDQVPRHALTLTIPALMAGRYIYCMVPGAAKATAVFNTLNQKIVEEYPSTILRTHNDAVLYLDALSSSKLTETTATIK